MSESVIMSALIAYMQFLCVFALLSGTGTQILLGVGGKK